MSSVVRPGNCVLESSTFGTRSGPTRFKASTTLISRKLASGTATLKKTVVAAPVRISDQPCAFPVEGTIRTAALAVSRASDFFAILLNSEGANRVGGSLRLRGDLRIGCG